MAKTQKQNQPNLPEVLLIKKNSVTLDTSTNFPALLQLSLVVTV